MNYLVPLYMQSRENITQAPDLIAPIQVNPDTFVGARLKVTSGAR
jgi:hypothetical protein